MDLSSLVICMPASAQLIVNMLDIFIGYGFWNKLFSGYLVGIGVSIGVKISIWVLKWLFGKKLGCGRATYESTHIAVPQLDTAVRRIYFKL